MYIYTHTYIHIYITCYLLSPKSKPECTYLGICMLVQVNTHTCIYIHEDHEQVRLALHVQHPYEPYCFEPTCILSSNEAKFTTLI